MMPPICAFPNPNASHHQNNLQFQFHNCLAKSHIRFWRHERFLNQIYYKAKRKDIVTKPLFMHILFLCLTQHLIFTNFFKNYCYSVRLVSCEQAYAFEWMFLNMPAWTFSKRSMEVHLRNKFLWRIYSPCNTKLRLDAW
jgi:hypothetical protein